MDTKPVFHGSDIEKICSYYNLKKEDIVKFGANVNPLGLSPKASKAIAEHVDLLSSYPDREYTSLRNTISRYCGIPADFILPGNGSSELISLLIEERAPKHTLILGPTYSEYSRELSFSGSTQEYYHLQENNDFEPDIPDLCKKLTQGYDFLILCNPNNPTGTLAEPASVCEVRLTFDTDLSHEIQPSLIENVRKRQVRGLPHELVRDYDVELLQGSPVQNMLQGGETVARREIRDNGQRLNCLAFEHVDCDAVRVTVRAAHGSPEARIFELRVY